MRISSKRRVRVGGTFSFYFILSHEGILSNRRARMGVAHFHLILCFHMCTFCQTLVSEGGGGAFSFDFLLSQVRNLSKSRVRVRMARFHFILCLHMSVFCQTLGQGLGWCIFILFYVLTWVYFVKPWGKGGGGAFSFYFMFSHKFILSNPRARVGVAHFRLIFYFHK